MICATSRRGSDRCGLLTEADLICAKLDGARWCRLLGASLAAHVRPKTEMRCTFHRHEERESHAIPDDTRHAGGRADDRSWTVSLTDLR